MPFDGRDNTPALNRARLIEALRAGPENWDFGQFEFCACGVAKHIGLVSNHFDYPDLGQVLGLTHRQAVDIFLGGDRLFGEDGTPKFYDVGTRGDVTPAMVADALERLA